MVELVAAVLGGLDPTLAHLAAELVLDLGVGREAEQGPAERGRGRLVAGEEEGLRCARSRDERDAQDEDEEGGEGEDAR